MIPAMVKRGYHVGFAAALVAAAATTDVLIPTSVAFVVYGIITEASIPRLFAAGVIPGLLMGVALVIPVLWMARNARVGWGALGDLARVGRAAWGAKWGLHGPRRDPGRNLRGGLHADRGGRGGRGLRPLLWGP